MIILLKSDVMTVDFIRLKEQEVIFKLCRYKIFNCLLSVYATIYSRLAFPDCETLEYGPLEALRNCGVSPDYLRVIDRYSCGLCESCEK